MSNIMVVIDNFGYGGLQKSGYFVTNSLAKAGHKLTFCSLENTNPIWEIDKSVALKHLSFIHEKTKKGKINQCIKTSIQLKKIIKTQSIEKIVVLGDMTLLITRLAATKGIILIGSERNSPERYNKLWKIIMNRLFRFCSNVVFQTPGARDCYSKMVRRKGIIIPNPYIRIPETIDKYMDEEYIATAAARFEYKKGIDTLISAFELLAPLYPRLKLRIVGDGPLKNEYISQCKESGILSRVEFPGLVRNVVNSINGAKVFILPSRFEGIPNILMEVMGAGIPVIASDCHSGGTRLLTDDGKVGMLYEIDNAKQLAEKISALLENDKERICLGRLGKNYIENNFDVDVISRKWIDLLEDRK